MFFESVKRKKYGALKFLVFGLSVLFISGCSMKFFSPGWKTFKNAENAWQKGDYSASLYFASESVKLDYELMEPKAFLKDHHEEGIKLVKSQLNNLSKNTISDAEKRAEIFINLDKYFTNLKNIKLPLIHEKEGWTWNPEIVDYSVQARDAKQNAYKLLVDKSLDLLKTMQIEQAEVYYKRAVSKYLTLGSSEYAKAKKNMKSVFTLAYFKRGEQKEKENNLQSYKSALKDYEKSFAWDSSNLNSKNKIKSVKNKIAELYYNDAKKLEKTDKNKAVEFYAQSLTWVKGYKDAAKRIKDLLISSELKKLEKLIAQTERQVSMLGNEPARMARDIAKAADAMDRLTSLSDTLRKADGEMKDISKTLAVFNVVPTVNTVTKATGKVVKDARKPVNSMVKKFDRVEKPVIIPVKENIGKLKNLNDAVVVKIRNVSATVSVAKRVVNEVNVCLETQQNPDALIKIGREVKDINEALVKVNKSLSATNKGLSAIRPGIKKIANLQPAVKRASDSASQIGQPIHEIKKATHEIDKVINESITFKTPITKKKITLSIKKILTGAIPKPAKVILNKFTDAAMKALDPVFKKLKIRIPPVKGLEEVKRGIDDIKHVAVGIANKTEKIKNSVADIDSCNNAVQTKLNSIKRQACSRL